MSMPDVAAVDPDGILSTRLRVGTAPLHAQIEALLGLPGTVRGRQDYCRLLGRFFGLYEPLERSFQRFGEWQDLALCPCNHSPGLSRDLLALGTDPYRVPRTPPAMMPALPTFPHALGALYVLEGSALGGRIVLRDLELRMGQQIAGATCFLSGRGAATGPMWTSFRATLDCFGRAQPQVRGDVLIGAESVFRALLTWFAPSVTSKPNCPMSVNFP